MKVAEPTVERLIQYYRLLIMMKEEGRKVVSSLQMGEMLGIKASQVRKDLSYFGEIGKRGVRLSCKPALRSYREHTRVAARLARGARPE